MRIAGPRTEIMVTSWEGLERRCNPPMSGSYSELEDKAERDLLTVAERAAYCRLGLLRFLASAK